MAAAAQPPALALSPSGPTRLADGPAALRAGLALWRRDWPLIGLQVLVLSLTLALFVLAAWPAFWGYQNLLDWLVSFLAEGWWRDWLTWGLRVVFVPAYLLILLVLFSPLCFLIALPFLDLVAERVQSRQTGSGAGAPWLAATLTGLRFGLRSLAWRLGLSLVCLPLLLVPLLGPLAWFTLNAWFTAGDFHDVYMARQSWTASQRAAWWRARRRYRLGFGLSTQLLLLLPLVNLLVPVWATTAATLTLLANPPAAPPPAVAPPA